MKHAGLIYALLSLSLVLGKTTAMGQAFPGARTAGMAHSGVAVYDIWAINHNPAGMSGQGSPAAAVAAENRYLLHDMNLAAAAILLPIRSGTLGLSLGSFGNRVYREGKLGLAFSRFFGERLSAGLQINYLHRAITGEYGSASTLAAAAGIILEPIPGLYVGHHVYNPGRAKKLPYDEFDLRASIPTLFRTGCAYAFSDEVLLSVELEKETGHRPALRLGAEYHPGERIAVRAGMGSRPMLNAFGFGIKQDRYQLDLSVSLHHVLGYSTQAGLSLSFP